MYGRQTERATHALSGWEGAVCAALLGVYLLWIWCFWPFTIDDAYISARYARHLAQGYGLVYNPGERVMGYTNLSLTLLEALVYRLGGDGIMAAKVVGALTGVGVIGLTFWLTRYLGGSKGASILAASFLAVYPALPLSAVMGLETSLFVFLVLLFVLLLLRWGDTPSSARQFLLAGTLWLATLTRPEALGVALVALVVQLGFQLPGLFRIRNLAQRAGWFVLYLLLLAPVLAGLTAYYGSPIPNTFFAKTAAKWMPAKYLGGLLYELRWLLNYNALLLLPAFVWAFARNTTRGTVTLVALIAFYAAYAIYAGGDWMPGYRFLLPVFPAFFALTAVGVDDIWHTVRVRFPRPGLWGLTVFLCFVASSVPAMLTESQHVHDRIRGYRQAHLQIALWLKENTPPETSVALMDIGLIGYISERYILDITGLTSREVARIAHRSGGWISASEDVATQVADFVLSRSPDYIVLAHFTPALEPFYGWAFDEAIFQAPSFASQYRYLFTLQHMDGYYLSVFQKQR